MLKDGRGDGGPAYIRGNGDGYGGYDGTIFSNSMEFYENPAPSIIMRIGSGGFYISGNGFGCGDNHSGVGGNGFGYGYGHGFANGDGFGNYPYSAIIRG